MKNLIYRDILTTKEVWEQYRISKTKLYSLREKGLIDRLKLDDDCERSKAYWKRKDIENLFTKE